MSIVEHIRKTKAASHELLALTESERNAVLASLAMKLRDSCDEILSANARDLEAMGQEDPMRDRLALTEKSIKEIASSIEKVVSIPSPLGKVLEHKRMPNDLFLEQVAVPLGVVSVIYESRPNVTIDVFVLCFKTGNACVLKGGKEAHHTNTVFVQIIQSALSDHHVNTDAVYLLPPNREETLVLLNAHGLVDVCIPRGSQSLINYVRMNAKIPVIETGAGIVHTYFDQSGDKTKARDIINNAKTRRISVCNALDCLLVHQDRLSDLYELVEPLKSHEVEIFADKKAYDALSNLYPNHLLFHAHPDDFGKEFLSYKLAIKTVDSIAEAVSHIMTYTSGHSEAILTENQENADYFIQKIDAAVVYVNTSTAFTDGGEFGMGAEIGISTQKLHARGPMGLEALTSYKWIVRGNGQVRE
jgi:glutamate-5-semialdehyde dehydrogenase